MADFPASPIIGQTYTVGNLTWTWNGVAWDSKWGAYIQGVQGTIGIQGIYGFQGIQGFSIQGIQGLGGFQGIQGTQGILGVQGQIGVQGQTGVQGQIGVQGQTGLQGFTGLQGTQGIFGTQGIGGANAVQGTQGIQGSQGDPTLIVTAAKAANYTLVLTDASDLLPINSASTVYVTIPQNSSVAFLQGTQINILRQGAGAVYIQGVSTTAVSVQGTPGLQMRAQYSTATAIKLGTDHWIVTGDLKA